MLELSKYFLLTTNNFCSDVPTEVQALSDGVLNWGITTGNAEIGTPCYSPSPQPTVSTLPSPQPTILPTVTCCE